jgi:hypothetical protein
MLFLSSGMCVGFLVLSVAALVGCCRAVPWVFFPLYSCDWRCLIGLLLFSSCVFACLVAMLPFFPPVIGVPISSLLPCILLSSAFVCPSTHVHRLLFSCGRLLHSGMSLAVGVSVEVLGGS